MGREKNTSTAAANGGKKRRPEIPGRIVLQLWVNSGGRCQYDGCNKSLLDDALTKVQYNQAYIAHIVAAEEHGPRGDKVKSPELATSYNNLMMLCDACHRRVDREDVHGHPVELLTKMKRKHEDRIKLVTGIAPNRESHIVLYGANIGVLNTPLSYKEAANTIMPTMFPASGRAFELSLSNCAFEDHTEDYWNFHTGNLIANYGKDIKHLTAQPDIHFSLFALAPIPLLIKLGTLLPDIYNVDVYQLLREPKTWKWQEGGEPIKYVLKEPEDKTGKPVLVFSLSGTITHDRVSRVVADKHSIWEITISNPGNDFMRQKIDLQSFRSISRQALDTIKREHGQDTELMVFPAMPVSAAVELGRIRMPKADMPFSIYDQNRNKNTFIHTIKIN